MRIGCRLLTLKIRLFTVFSVWKTTLVKVKHRISSKFNHFPILIYAKYFTIVLIMALWWRRKIDFLRSYLLVCFGHVIDDLTSWRSSKLWPISRHSFRIEYERMFFFLLDTLKKVHEIRAWTWKKIEQLKELGQGVVDKLPKPDHTLFFLC